jgi:hypothetical protein
VTAHHSEAAQLRGEHRDRDVTDDVDAALKVLERHAPEYLREPHQPQKGHAQRFLGVANL